MQRLDLSRTRLQPASAPALARAALSSVLHCVLAGNSLGDVVADGIAQVRAPMPAHIPVPMHMPRPQVVTSAPLRALGSKQCLDLSNNDIHGPAALRLV